MFCLEITLGLSGGLPSAAVGMVVVSGAGIHILGVLLNVTVFVSLVGVGSGVWSVNREAGSGVSCRGVIWVGDFSSLESVLPLDDWKQTTSLITTYILVDPLNIGVSLWVGIIYNCIKDVSCELSLNGKIKGTANNCSLPKL